MKHTEDDYLKGMRSAARYLNISLGELASLKRRGLPYAKINGLVCFSRDDLDDFIVARFERLMCGGFIVAEATRPAGQ